MRVAVRNSSEQFLRSEAEKSPILEKHDIGVEFLIVFADWLANQCANRIPGILVLKISPEDERGFSLWKKLQSFHISHIHLSST